MAKRVIDILKKNAIAQSVYFDSSLGVRITDKNGKILDVNDRYCQIYGYTNKKDVIGEPASITIPDDKKEASLVKLVELISHQGNLSNEFSDCKADGSLIEVAISISTFKLNDIPYSISFIQDISEYSKTNRLLRETEKVTGVGAWEVDLKTEKATWTDTVYEIYGVNKSTFTDLKMAINFYPPEERVKLNAALEKLIQNGESYTIEQRFIDNFGNEKWVRATGHAFQQNDKVTRIYGTFTDVTEERKERLLRERLSRVASETPNAVIILDKNMKVEWVNEGFCKMTGYKSEEVFGKFPGDFLTSKNSDTGTLKQIEEALVSQKGITTEVLHKRKNDEEFWVNLQIIPVFDEKKEIKEFFSIQEEISERKKQQLEQKKALEEKTYLLAEIHHRVKNNLATISGLLELQKFSTYDQKIKEVLQDSVNRIKSMSEIHEMIYKSDKFNEINIGSYTRKLIERIGVTFNKTNIKALISEEDVKLGLNVALPVALLVNELVTNSFKHAFPNTDEGKIQFEIHKNGTTVEIIYSDNGIGIDGHNTFSNLEESKSLGMQLIHTFLEQIHADYELKTQEEGFCLRFRFENVDIKEGWLNKVKN